MAYPVSADVSAGDATLATQYNNLRNDALYLGQSSANAVNLAAFLERYESRLKLVKIAFDQVRVEASASEPVSLVIDGYMLRTPANIALETTKPTGAAKEYYVFAKRAAGSTTFTLTTSTSPTETTSYRRIGRFYWDGSAIVTDSVRTELAEYINDITYFLDPQICDGRLTLSSGYPVPASDVSSSTNVYFTPFTGNRIALYVQDYGWRLYAFSEITYSLSGSSADTNYDIFIYDNNGTLTLTRVAWASGSARAEAIVRQDGVWVLSSNKSRRYLGTVRTNGAGGASVDTDLERFVFNAYNRVQRFFLYQESTNSWTYAVASTWRRWYASDTPRVNFVLGLAEVQVQLSSHLLAEHSGANVICTGIGLDSISSNDAQILRGITGLAATYNNQWYGAHYVGYPSIGFHYLQMVEYTSAATMTCYGDNGASNVIQSGCIGSLTI